MVLKVLVVEDDLLIADMIEDRLRMDGLDVCGIATNIKEAITLAEQKMPDVAVLDVRLADGDLGTELAPQLKKLRRDIGILYATGNTDAVIGKAVGEGCLQKPYRMTALAPSLKLIIEIIQHGVAQFPLPDGLILLRP